MAACVYSVERRPRIFMAERKLPTRAAILAAGCIMFLFTGTIYAWSILSSPFPVEFGWTSAQLGLNFTIVMSCFCIGGLAGSFVTRRLSARVTVLIGAVMCFLGYFLCSHITAQSLWLLYISYGGLIGLGVGFSYNAVLGTVVGWFPDKKGFASGVLLMGFGCSTLIMGNLADRLFNSAMGWRTAYLLLGAATLVVLLIGSRWVVPNPQMAAPAGSAAAPTRREYTAGQMVKTAAFWLLFFIIVCSNMIGTGVIGHSRYIAVEAGVATGITALVVGLQSVCNGLGRLAFGTLFDKKGNTFAMLTDVGCFILSCLLLLFSLRGGGAIPAVAGLLLIGFSYGGMPTMTSTVTADCFGTKNYGTNFSIANMSMLPASFGATIVGAIQTGSGTYVTAFLVFLGVTAVVILLDLAFRGAAKKL